MQKEQANAQRAPRHRLKSCSLYTSTSVNLLLFREESWRPAALGTKAHRWGTLVSRPHRQVLHLVSCCGGEQEAGLDTPAQILLPRPCLLDYFVLPTRHSLEASREPSRHNRPSPSHLPDPCVPWQPEVTWGDTRGLPCLPQDGLHGHSPQRVWGYGSPATRVAFFPCPPDRWGVFPFWVFKPALLQRAFP